MTGLAGNPLTRVEAEAFVRASAESSAVPASCATAQVVVPVCSPKLELKGPHPEEDVKFSRLSLLSKVLPRKLRPCPKDTFSPAELFAQAVLDSGDVPTRAPLACVPVATGPMLIFLDKAKQRIAGRSVRA